MPQSLPEPLTKLVRHAIATLGQAVREEAGDAIYQKIEGIRRTFKGMRSAEFTDAVRCLNLVREEMESLSPEERWQVGHSFALMLELINTCEHAYRTYRLKQLPEERTPCGARSILYVLTAHPTEARSTECVAIFQRIQSRLIEALERGYHRIELSLLPLLKIAWKIPMAKTQTPTIQDEAIHLYSAALREEAVDALLRGHLDEVPVFLRTWVGGDKDGHPGVDRNAMVDSLTLSRNFLLDRIDARFNRMEDNLSLLEHGLPPAQQEAESLQDELRTLRSATESLAVVGPDDGHRVREFTRRVSAFRQRYDALVGSPTLNSAELGKLFYAFPGLVVPLELRENADLIRRTETERDLAIVGMLECLAAISRGGNPKWYVRGLIVSMVESSRDVEAAASLVEAVFGGLAITVVPLLEKESALQNAVAIVRKFLEVPRVRRALEGEWKRHFEVMLGYSDSAKEIGSLPSRLLIAEAMRRLEEYLASEGITPIFFHGAGGSVARGGGSIYEQTSWWPESSLRTFKVTIQGEMVQRNFASAPIVTSQLKKVADISRRILEQERMLSPAPAVLSAFSHKVRDAYKTALASEGFVEAIQKATMYGYLKDLKLGSRPAKRAPEFSLDNIRAIPWILCWTQSRVLFPVWWGVGSAWENTQPGDRAALRDLYGSDELFRSYIKLLAFTLAKVELPVWHFLLQHSELAPETSRRLSQNFREEFERTVSFVREITGEENLLWFRPWLGESIRLRSSMIHPLNILQHLALKENDMGLLRETVTGIACGMLTTG